MSLRAAFLGSSYGSAQERAYLAPTTQGFCPSWAATASYARSYAILTAWNPEGQPRDTQANALAQACLQADLAKHRLLHAYNGAGQWQEEAFIVSGLSLKGALELGQKYQQAAVIWGTGARVALAWCSTPECASKQIERFWWSSRPYPR